MAVKTGKSQVKFKVRYNALIFREFTVSDMVRATGLNPESIRTELQRMKQEGLLTSERHPQKHDKRGGHPSIYRLADDPEARLALSESIEAFYPSLPTGNEPTSRHYMSAKQTLDLAQTADEPECKQLLAAVKDDLEIAEQAEGGSLASDSVKAHLQYERARFVYLKGKHELAQELLNSLSQFFMSVNNTAMTQKVQEFQLYLMALARQRELGGRASMRPDVLARCVIQVVKENTYEISSPLALFLVNLLCELSQTTEDKIKATALERAAEYSKQDVGSLKMQINEVQTRVMILESKTLQFRRESEDVDLRHYSELFEDLATAHSPIGPRQIRHD